MFKSNKLRIEEDGFCPAIQVMSFARPTNLYKSVHNHSKQHSLKKFITLILSVEPLFLVRMYPTSSIHLPPCLD